MKNMEWINLGDANFFDYGGTMVRYDKKYDQYDFFHLDVLSENGHITKYAYYGTVTDLTDWTDQSCLKLAASEYDNVNDFIQADPANAVATLVEELPYGPMEFNATNWMRTGAYSLTRKDFVCTDEELVKMMRDIDIPEEFIPTLRFKVRSYFAHDFSGLSSSLEANDPDEALAFILTELQRGGFIQVDDRIDDKSFRIDADRYAKAVESGVEVDIDLNYMVVSYNDDDLGGM